VPSDRAPLYLRVQNVFHVGAARIGQNGSVSERAGAPFHPALKPADHFSIGNCLRGLPNGFFFVGNV
jgi:hypothetical protein